LALVVGGAGKVGDFATRALMPEKTHLDEMERLPLPCASASAAG
jgi:hypothetical protein